jgi:LmbE family N-acetylglucosaminyl deacetylase
MTSSDAPRAPRLAWLYALLEAGWALGFAAAGGLLHARRGMRGWEPAGGPVLVVAPHPDDEAIACGGAIALHRLAGEPVDVWLVTDGGASGAAGADVRAAEAQAAAVVLGGTWHSLELPEGRWPEDEARAPLRRALAELAPAVVYAPSCVDYHPEHLQVARALAAALADLEADVAVRIYEAGVPLTPALANRVVPIDEVAALKDRALAAYASQQVALRAVSRLQRCNRRLFGARGRVEVFWEMPAGAYVRLMAAGRWRTHRESPFYGVRHRPLTDALPYLIGWRARRVLQRAAGLTRRA